MDAARKCLPAHIFSAHGAITRILYIVFHKKQNMECRRWCLSQHHLCQKRFKKALMDLRKTPAGAALNILVGIPHIRSLAALRFWFILMNIVPEKHPEAAFCSINFKRRIKMDMSESLPMHLLDTVSNGRYLWQAPMVFILWEQSEAVFGFSEMCYDYHNHLTAPQNALIKSPVNSTPRSSYMKHRVYR